MENELCYDYNYELCSFSNLSVTSPTSQLIHQPFCRFTYITGHSPTLLLLHLRHSSFSNPAFASLTSQVLHLIHLRRVNFFEIEDFEKNRKLYIFPSHSKQDYIEKENRKYFFLVQAAQG